MTLRSKSFPECGHHAPKQINDSAKKTQPPINYLGRSGNNNEKTKTKIPRNTESATTSHHHRHTSSSSKSVVDSSLRLAWKTKCNNSNSCKEDKNSFRSQTSTHTSSHPTFLLYHSLPNKDKMMLSPSAARMGTVSTTLRHIGKQQHLSWSPKSSFSCRSSSSSSSFSSFAFIVRGTRLNRKIINNINNSNAGRRTFLTTTSTSNAVVWRRETNKTKMTSTRTTFGMNNNCPLRTGTTAWKSTMASTVDSDDDEDDYNDRSSDQQSPMYVAEAVAEANKNAHIANTNAAASSGSSKSSSSSSSSPSLLAQQEAWMINLGRDDNDQWLTGPRDPNEWFTGVQPSDCPGVEKVSHKTIKDKNNNKNTRTKEKYILRSLPLPRLDNVTRKNVKEYFDNSWTLYETLFAGLNGEEYFYRYVVL